MSLSLAKTRPAFPRRLSPRRLSLVQTFSLLSGLITACVAVALALIVQHSLQDTALRQTTSSLKSIRALYVGAVPPSELVRPISTARRDSLDRLADSVLAANQVVALVIWDGDRHVWYRSSHGFTIATPQSNLRDALSGHEAELIVNYTTSSRPKATSSVQGRLLRVIAPIVSPATKRDMGVIELDGSLATVDTQVGQSTQTVWVGLAVGFAILYLVFFLLVRRVSGALVKQSEENKRLAAIADARARDARMLNAVGQRLNREEDLSKVVAQILQSASEAMGFENTVLLVMRDDELLHVVGGTGSLAAKQSEQIRVAMGAGIVGRAALVGRMTYVADVRQDADYIAWTADTRSAVALPLKLADDVIGVLEVERPLRDGFSARDRQNLAAFADMSAGAIQNALLKEERERNRLTLLTTMANNLDARDQYTAGHSRRVTNYAMIIAAALGYDGNEMELLQRAGKMHDIGKIGVPDAILLKPSRLEDDERMIMERHSVIGCEILKDERFLWPALPLIRHHHERWDGHGYPDGLKGTEIPLGARVLAVADTFDAMTSDRPYRKGLSLERAFSAIQEGSGTQFDPQVAGVMLAALSDGRLVIEREALALAAAS